MGVREKGEMWKEEKEKRCYGDRKIERRIDLKSPPNKKSFCIYRAEFLVFIEQQTRNEKARKNEKQVNANPTHLRCVGSQIVMRKQNQDYG